jgi:hypothetical protein
MPISSPNNAGPFRISALDIGGGAVHVIFAANLDRSGAQSGLYMRADTYRAIPLDVAATPADYAALAGPDELQSAPTEFTFDLPRPFAADAASKSDAAIAIRAREAADYWRQRAQDEPEYRTGHYRMAARFERRAAECG